MNPIKKIKIGFDDTEKFRNHFYPYVRGTIGRGELKKKHMYEQCTWQAERGPFWLWFLRVCVRHRNVEVRNSFGNDVLVLFGAAFVARVFFFLLSPFCL